MAKEAEHALEDAKHSGRDRLTLFGETVTWAHSDKLSEIGDSLEQWFAKGLINKSMLYRLNILTAMVELERQVVQEKTIQLKDMNCTKWRAMLAYTAERNIAKKLKGADRASTAHQIEAEMRQWLDSYGGNLKIPLWKMLYDNR